MPRTSDACYVCKSRKIRCDMQIGGCNGCKRSGISCPGRSSKNQAYKPRFKIAVRGDTTASSKVSSQVSKATKLQFAAATQTLNVFSPNPGPQMRSQALCHFLEAYLPENGVGTGLSHFSYLSMLHDRFEESAALRSAVECLTTSQVGAELHDDALLHHASCLYSQALRHMAHALTRAVPTECTLAASVLLGLCEFTSSTSASGRGWTSHVAGQLRMLQVIGPDAVQHSPFLFHLFLNVRNASISLGAIERRSSLFNDPDWLALTSSTSLIDSWIALGDLNIATPGLLERVDRFARGDGSLDMDATIAELLWLEERLAAWERQWRPSASAHGPWLVDRTHVSTTKALPTAREFAQVHHFADFRAGIMHLSFWVSRIALLRIRQVVGACLALPVPATPLSRGAGMHACAVQIARSAAFCCQPRFGSTGRIAALVCLKHPALYFLEVGLDDEARWCSLLVAHIKAAGVCQPPILVAS